MNNIVELLYWYCTDFCINAANMLGITYVEFNFLLFIVLFPLVTVGLLFANVIRLFLPSKKKTSSFSSSQVN